MLWRGRLGFMGYSFCLTGLCLENTKGSIGVLELRIQAEMQDNAGRAERERKTDMLVIKKILEREERLLFCDQMF